MYAEAVPQKLLTVSAAELEIMQAQALVHEASEAGEPRASKVTFPAARFFAHRRDQESTADVLLQRQQQIARLEGRVLPQDRNERE